MNNQTKIEKPKFDKKKWAKEYMKAYYEKKKFECIICHKMIFAHAEKQHKNSNKHKFLLISSNIKNLKL